MKISSPKPLLYISALFAIISGMLVINTSISFLFPNEYIQNQKAQVGGTFSVHVSPSGDDASDGSSSFPLATIEAALVKFNAQSNTGEIVVHGGTYNLTKTIEIRPNTANSARLNIVAASGENPLFRGDQAVSPSPLEGYQGIYLIPGKFNVNLPEIWDETLNNKARYNKVLDFMSLLPTDYSVYLYSPDALAIHPPGGKLPESGNLRISIIESAFSVTRSNVTIKGLSFSGFSKSYLSAGIIVGFGSPNQGLTTDVIIKDSFSENSYLGFYIKYGSDKVTISNCIIKDVAGGIHQRGGHSTIEYNKIYNDDSPSNKFAFKNPDLMTGGGGIFVYFDSLSATLKFNFISGFSGGIRIKAPVPGGPYIVEHNTIIDNPYIRKQLGQNSDGIAFIWFNSYGKDYAIVRYNIMYGQSLPFNYSLGTNQIGAVVDKNIFFSTQPNNSQASAKFLKDLGIGENTITDPLFINPNPGDSSDYHISATSPALTISDDKDSSGQIIPIGALSVSNAPVQSYISPVSPNQTPSYTKVVESNEKFYSRSNKYGFVAFVDWTVGVWKYISYRKKGETTWTKGFDQIYYDASSFNPGGLSFNSAKPLIVVGLEPNTTYEYTITNRYNTKEVSSIFEVTTNEEPRTYYVSANGVDSRNGGDRNSPLKTLQYAIDLSLPGDTIKLLPGVYLGPFIMFNSGINGHPITIEAEQRGTAILDGQKLKSLMFVGSASNIIVKNLVFQSVNYVGLYFFKCNFIEVANNLFKNSYLGAHEKLATALRFGSSNDIYAHNNLIYGWWSGVLVESSPRTKFTHNTITDTALDGLAVTNVSDNSGSEFTYNSINFISDHALTVTFNDSNKKSVTIDYNNYGTKFQKEHIDQIDPDTIISNLISPWYFPGSRELMYGKTDVYTGAYYSFSKWKSDSGFDTHSIFADPLWVDPLNGKFNLKPESPNLLPGGEYIGAFDTKTFVNDVSYTPLPNTVSSPTPGSCSTSLNSCATGTFSDVSDSTTHNLWICLGLNGGSNTTCSSPKDPNLSPTPTPILRATDGICGSTLNSCTQGILRNTEDSTTQYLWMCLGSNNGFDASCSQTRYIPPVTTNPPTNPVTQTQNPRVNQTRTPSTYKPQPTIYKTGTTPNKDTYTINIPTSTIDITLPKPPSWLDVIKTLLNKIITNVIRGVKRTGEVVGI